MRLRIAFGLLWAGSALGGNAWAQTVCPPTPRYSPCDLVFDIPEAKGETLDLHAEFRSPLASTALVNAFWDGGTKWVIRFTPIEAGNYTYRLTSAIESLNGKQGGFTVTPNNKEGWLRAANLHHFASVEGNTLTPYLWMGGVVPGFPSLSAAAWRDLVDRRAAQHFNHLGITLVDASVGAGFRSPEFYRAAEEKIRYANDRGIVVDIAFFGPDGLMNRLLPEHEDRQKWFTYALSRLAAFDVTWQGLEGWETYDNGRAVLKEIAEYESNLDPYKHTRSSRTNCTSAPLADDGWLRYRSYQTADDRIMAVEQQIFQYPAVSNFGVGAGDAATFRRHLWNATVDGAYPDTVVPDEASAAAMKVWYEFMEKTRHWELEPFFDSTSANGFYRGLALDGIEYVIYVEKPSGPVTVNVEPHGYDVEWLNPATGERVKGKKENKGDPYVVTPPDNGHDWVLHISREGTKASMLKTYKFVSREQDVVLQEVEGNPEKVPFEIVDPSADSLSLSKPVRFQVRFKRHTKAIDETLFEWTGEVTVDERSYRVIGTGADGTFTIPANIAAQYPAALHIRLQAMNALGKVYVLDRNYTLTK
jgi:hypothetical protein